MSTTDTTPDLDHPQLFDPEDFNPTHNPIIALRVWSGPLYDETDLVKEVQIRPGVDDVMPLWRQMLAEMDDYYGVRWNRELGDDGIGYGLGEGGVCFKIQVVRGVELVYEQVKF